MKNLMMAAAVAVLAFGAFGDDVEYWDCAGSSNLTVFATLITEGGTLSSGWYYINGTNELDSSLCCEGVVRIILKDGASLTVRGDESAAGVSVGESVTLEIYGQRLGTGALIAYGGDYAAGIGGDDGYSCGAVTVNGGTVTATGGDLAAGIGGGYDGAGGMVTINAGTLTATGGVSGAGIGGGYGWAGDTVTINGGTVTAVGVDSGAGIGGGEEGAGGIVTINGGVVTATGGGLSAGIGGGYAGEGGDVTIQGGTVTATGGKLGAGIGGGDEASGGTVTISGGRVVATGGEDEKGGEGGKNIGCGYEGLEELDDGTVVITGGIFGMTVESGWYTAGLFQVVKNRDSETSATYPWAVVSVGSEPTCEGGTCEWDDTAMAWIVKPADGVTTVTVANLPAAEKVAVPPSVTQVKGVSDGRIRVGAGAHDITGAFTVTGGAIALNPDGAVDGVPVTPTIEAVGEVAPFAVGAEAVALTVRTIPELVYSLRRGSSPRSTDGGWGTVGEPVVGDGTAKTLSDAGSLPDKAFYVVVVSVPSAVAAKNAAR